MINKPPNWKQYLSPDFFENAFKNSELQDLIKHAGKDYAYWDKFKYYAIPEGFSAEQAWAYLKFSRMSTSEKTPVVAKDGANFVYVSTKAIYQKLSYIDSNTSGFLPSSQGEPTESQKNQLIISGLSEEAIASSQIEGANTSRKVAKEMLLSQRKPRTKSEQMIINNFQVMQRLLDWKDLDLSKEMLLEIQQNITRKTLDVEADSGRFRKDSDDIHVVDPLTGVAVFTPPKEKIYLEQLDNLIDFANTKEKEDAFIHPVIKACILHFWIAYLHPFVDGNGRTARAIFYWYLLKNKYWLFQYLSVSRAIKLTRSQYDEAYLKTEYDGNDLTYFILYNLKAIRKAIEDFGKHYEKKLQEDKRNEHLAKQLRSFNERQVALLYWLSKKPQDTIDIKTHKTKHQIAYQTARSDIQQLVEKNLVTQMTDNKKYVYVPNSSNIKKLMKVAKDLE